MQMGTKIKALHYLVLILITLADDGEWKELSPTGTPPTARFGHSAVWDDTAGSMLVFGGHDGSWHNDLHRYEVETDKWITLSPSGSAPSARWDHTAMFESSSRTMLVFGGYDGSSPLNDLYRFDVQANAWSRLSPSGSAPAARGEHTAVLDSTTRTMLIFAGHSGENWNDLHAYSVQANSWSALSPSGGRPVARKRHTAVMDVASRAMLVFGGTSNSGGLLNDLHRYDVQSNAWSALSPSGTAPSPRDRHAAVWESTLMAMLVCGGLGNSGNLNDMHKYDVEADAWSALSPSGTLPSARLHHSAVWVHESRKMLLFGGEADSRLQNDLHALEHSACDAGSQLSGDGSCEACAPGRFSAGGQQACAACAAGHDSEAGSSACQPTSAHVVNGLAEPELSISRIGSAVVRLQVTLALLPQEVFNFAGLSYVIDIAAAEAALSARSACAAKWEISEGVASIQLNYTELSHPCTTNVTNTESGIRRDGVVGVHLMGESDGALEVIFAWVQELTLTFSALANASISYGNRDIFGFVTLGAQTFDVGGFSSTLQLFTSEAFATVKSVNLFSSNDVVYAEHKLDNDDGSLKMDVVMAWLSQSSEASDLDAVEYNVTSVLVRHDDGSARFVRYSFKARPCQGCYLHSLAQVTHKVDGRRLEPSVEHSFTLQSLYLDMMADDTSTVKFPEILMGPTTVLCVTVAAAAVAGIFAKLLSRRVARPAFGATSIQAFRWLEAGDCLSGIFVLVLIHAYGDLEFANDGGAIFIALATSAGLSIMFFFIGVFFEVQWRGQSQAAHLRTRWATLQEQKKVTHDALACAHLAVEDSFQTLLYTFIVLSHADGSFGVSPMVLGGVVRAGAFLTAKILEVRGMFDPRGAPSEAPKFFRGVPVSVAPPADPPSAVLGAPAD